MQQKSINKTIRGDFNGTAENMVTFHRKKNPKKMKMVTCLQILLHTDFPNSQKL